MKTKLLLSLLFLFAFLFKANAQCTVYATHTVVGPCQFQFYGTGSGISDISWDFGDGTTGTGYSPGIHIFPADGVYTVCAVGIDFGGNPCDTSCFLVTATGCSAASCTVTASATFITPCQLQFNGTGSGVSTLGWDFGDGGTASGYSPTHTYAGNGTYTVCCTGYDSAGMACDTFCFVITVSGCVAPSCGVSGTYTLIDPCTAQFAAGSSWGSTYTWTFGDGGTGTGTSPTHTYAASGAYTACVTAFDSVGTACDTVCFTVNVSSCAPPPACTVYTTYTFMGPCQLQFYATNTISYSWNFGDGSVATGYNPTHTYTMDGVYTVCCTGYNSSGAACDTVCFPVTVSGCSPASCSVTANLTMSGPCSYYFYATGTGASSYSWDFGDGVTGMGATVPHTYASDGLYTACVIGYNASGLPCDTACMSVTVSGCSAPSCTITPYYTLTSPCTAYFYVTGSGSSTYTWNFGDGGSGSGPSISHTYAMNGVYTVCCVGYNSSGVPCDTVCIVVNINSCASSIPEFNSDADIIIYPNPALDFITMETLSLPMSAYSIIDITGKLLGSGTINGKSIQIPLQEMDAGMYTVLVYGTNSELLTAKRFVKGK